MGILARLFGRRSIPLLSNRASIPASSTFTFSSIYKNATVIACSNVIANSISILPLNLYRRNPKSGAREKALKHPLYTLLRRRPNLSESPTQFMAKILRHIMQKGNAYIFKNVVGGKILSLHALNPEAVTELYDGLRVSYRYNGTDYSDAEVLHIPSLITDDYGKGYAPIEMARTAVTLGIQLDEYSLSAFGNGINTKLLIDISEMLKGVDDTEKAQRVVQTVADYIHRNYTGSENAGKPLIPLNGMKVTELQHQFSNVEAQLLESRKWQELEICKVLGVPPFLVNGTYDVKYGGLEQAMTIFLNFCISPYLRHIEQRLATLLEPYEQEFYYFEFDFNVLLRADEKSRAEFYTKLFAMGAIDPAGICARENLEPPKEGGTARFVPANMMPLQNDVLGAYMAGAKLKAEQLGSGKGIGAAPADPARAAGDQAQ